MTGSKAVAESSAISRPINLKARSRQVNFSLTNDHDTSLIHNVHARKKTAFTVKASGDESRESTGTHPGQNDLIYRQTS